MSFEPYSELVYVQERGRLAKKVRNLCSSMHDVENCVIPKIKRARKDNATVDKKKCSTTTLQSLYELSLNCITENFELVDSLVHLPSLIGETLCQHVLSKCTDADSVKLAHIFLVFTEAYGNEFLEHLVIRNSKEMIRNYVESLKIVIHHVTDLELSCCGLGDNHPLISEIAQASNICRLNLHDNKLTCLGMRRLCLPMVTFGKGPANLKELDLSSNKILEKSLKYLKSFKKLELVNVSDGGVTALVASTIAKSLGMVVTTVCRSTELKMSGWAAPFVKQLVDKFSEPEDITNPKYKFYGLKKQRNLKSSANTLLFIKVDNECEMHDTVVATPSSSKSQSIDENQDLKLLSLYSATKGSSNISRACLWET